MNEEVKQLYCELVEIHDNWYDDGRGNNYEQDVAKGVEMAMNCMEERFPWLEEVFLELLRKKQTR